MFEVLDPKTLEGNIFSLLDDRWGLLTVKDGEGCNPMTVSWGGAGILWGKPVITVYVRSQRYTRHLIDGEPYFSLTFLPEELHQAAVICGSKSGRDTDKVKECGLTVLSDREAPYFQEGEITFICKKLYEQEMTVDHFADKELGEKWYGDGDCHKLYIGEILALLKKK